MSTEELSKLDYNEDEMKRRQKAVMGDLNKYVRRKYPELLDAEVVKKSAKSRSVLDICGIRLKPLNNQKPVFLCLMGNCFAECERIKITFSSTSNATSHLFGKHGVVASKTEAHNRNVATLNKFIEGADATFRADPVRWFEVHLSAFSCENSIAYAAFESTTWKLIADKLPVGSGKSLQSINLRKLYVEHYVSIKQHIMECIRKAKYNYYIPFIALSIDLIQNELQNKKMIGVRISYVHENQLCSHNLAVRGFNPGREQMESQAASELLVDWCTIILKEFGITPEQDILTSCTDSGSDVKKALEKVFPTIREWCVSHLTHLALADAFGSHIDPKKTKNSDMRNFLMRCRKVIEKVNKSKNLKVTLEKKLLTEFGQNMKLRNSPSHRWSATEDVFVRLLRCWSSIRNSFIEEGIPFPISNDRELMLELRSLIHPLRFIQTTAQKTKELAVLQVYVLLMEAYFGVLDDRTPLNIYDPAVTVPLGEGNSTNKKNNPLDKLVPTKVVPGNELDLRTIRVRKMLRSAMYQRFYKRYHPKEAYKGRIPRVAQKKDFHFSYLFDMQAMFHPALSNGNLLQKIIYSFEDATREEKQHHLTMVKGFIWQTIQGLAERVAFNRVKQEKEDKENEIPVSVDVPAKKRRIDDPTLTLLQSLIATNNTSNTESRSITPQQKARNEINYYQAITPDQWPTFDETLNWWHSRVIREAMPCLSQVATAILGCNPSSGGLECDFGFLKDVIKPKRAALGQGFVEVEMMLKMNKHLFFMNPEKVHRLPNDKWQEYIPQRTPTNEGLLGDFDDDGSITRDATTANNDEQMDDETEESEEEEVRNEEERSIDIIESENDEYDDTLDGGFQADEYGDIIPGTLEVVTESQLSTLTVFDPDETQKPGSLL
jgi:hypothetical protein